jgi:hypothetical protein
LATQNIFKKFQNSRRWLNPERFVHDNRTRTERFFHDSIVGTKGFRDGGLVQRRGSYCILADTDSPIFNDQNSSTLNSLLTNIANTDSPIFSDQFFDLTDDVGLFLLMCVAVCLFLISNFHVYMRWWSVKYKLFYIPSPLLLTKQSQFKISIPF